MGDSSRKVLRGPSLHVVLPEGSLGQILHERMLRYRDRTAFIDEYSGQSITYNELLHVSYDLSNALRNFHFTTEDTIAVCSECRIFNICPILAALYLGITAVPICDNYDDEELTHALSLTRPKIVFCSRKNLQRFYRLHRQMIFIQRVVILDFQETPEEVDTIDSFIRSNMARHNSVDVENFIVPYFDVDNHVAFVIFSSGTTALPKGVMVTHKNMITSIVQFHDPNLRITQPDGPLLCIMPLFHLFGLTTALGVLFAGVCGRVFSRFDEETFLKALEKYKISVISLMPSLVVLLAKSPLVDRYDLSYLREISFCAGFVSESTQDRVKERLNVTNIRQMYGMAETTSIVAAVPAFYERKGSVGKVLSTISVMIRDPDTGENLGPNQTGEICLKGDLIMKGYYRNPTETREIFMEDGWMRSGDLGYFDDDEYIFLVDRLNELIKYRGYQVPPRELEALLLRHPYIRECGVVGLPDPRSGELPMAFVVRQSDVEITEREIVEYIAANISDEKRLRGGVRFIDEIPKNASGRMLRRVLRMMVREMFDR